MFENVIARKLSVNGIVQGVGFRPFIYQLANRHGIKGEVANTSSGVAIHVEGIREDIESFCIDMEKHQPPLAQVTEINSISNTVVGFEDFLITKSSAQASRSTLISPDVTVCKDCLTELFDPSDRRYHYPFINCTNCGPRYTIIADVPYDRPNTSMQRFTLCKRCQAEYDNPSDRRFHAQPNACPDCGPHVSLFDRFGKHIAGKNAIQKTAELLRQGHIVAVKGLGGFHLAVDAENHDAVVRLRKRKHREERPLAVMSREVQRIRQYAHVEPEEEALLYSIQRPIVLLRKKEHNALSEAISPLNRYIGAMLCYTPLHYLLLNCDFTALVMTSANKSEEPISIDNEEAFNRLSGISDYFLTHDRDIYLRCDDSIVKRTAGSNRLIRRSRGYVPTPVFLKKPVPQVLACGAELKNTVCLTKENKAFLSQHIGDLKNLEAHKFFNLTIEHMKRILDIDPEIVAYDLHPDYLSTRYAQALGDIEKIPVQHHHAHVVSAMAENSLEGPVIGISLDGTGYGTDGKIWGGEILVVEPSRFERAAHLSYVPMPGGGSAIKEPWRMAVSYLFETFGQELRVLDLPLVKHIEEQKAQMVIEMITKQINSPHTSSLGRLFDGVSAIIGLRNHVSFEGQAAMELEMIAGQRTTTTYDYEWVSEGVHRILIPPIIRGITQDMAKGVPLPEISRKFHETLIKMFSELCRVIRKERGLNRVVLSGGVFQNSLLLSGLVEALEKTGFQVFTHTQIPTNDGGIALGQAIVAAAIA
jgi:hydrogenase maturation protein HypF